jgi:hypothetical protein
MSRRRTANLQKETITEAAKRAGISERSFYMARRIRALRPDLAERCLKGEMSLNAALKIAEGKTAPTSWDRLLQAWRNATDEDRARLTMLILMAEQDTELQTKED